MPHGGKTVGERRHRRAGLGAAVVPNLGPLGLIPLPIPCAVRELGRRVLEFLNDIISFSKKNKKTNSNTGRSIDWASYFFSFRVNWECETSLRILPTSKS